MRQEKKLYRWELALLLGLAAAMLLGLWLDGTQAGLREKVLRLHVIANSDSEEDQTLKLKVRDEILELAEEWYEPDDDRESAERKLTANLGRLAEAGAAVVQAEGYDYPVTATLEDAWFPTKRYTDFSLPSGEYRALRIVIGEGGGENWWCVVFPPLCLDSVTEEVAVSAAAGGLSEREVRLITGESEGYILKFKAIEWWEAIKHRLEQNA